MIMIMTGSGKTNSTNEKYRLKLFNTSYFFFITVLFILEKFEKLSLQLISDI